MRYRPSAPTIFASVSALMLVRSAWGLPGYDIYPIPAANGYNVILGQGISSGGTYVAGVVEPSAGYSNGVLYNTASGSSTFEIQTGVTYGPPGRGTAETTGVPYSVNNNGIMFGSSGDGSTVETGQPTVWQNGQGYSLPIPLGSGSGQVYGSNNLNQAVGTVGSATGALDQAAIFFYYGVNNNSNYAAELTEGISNGGNMQVAFGINDNDVIVGTGNDPNNAALTVPYIYTLGANTATIIPNSSSKFNSGIPFAISNSGLVTGAELYNSGGGDPFIYNMSSGVTTSIPVVAGTGGGEGRAVNDSGEVVGTDSGLYAVPFLYDGTNSYDLQTLLVNNQSYSWQLDDNTSSGASGIDDNGDIVGRAMYNGVLTAFIMVPTGTSKAAAQNLTWNNAGGSGDGATWDTTSQNWNNGSGVSTFSSANNDNVTFNDNNNGHYNVSIPVTVTPGSTTFDNSAGNYIVTGAGGIGGGFFYKLGTGTLTLDTVNSYVLPTNIEGGTVIYGVEGALPSGARVEITGPNASVVLSSVGPAYAQTFQSLGISTGNTLDLTNNDLIIQQDTLLTINGDVANGFNGGAWNGTTGIISSLAGPSHPLMAIGAIINDNGSGTPLYGTGGTIASTFGGADPADGNILVKYTYYGDANLDGQVDASDYSRIDAAYLADQTYLAENPTGTNQPLTGWYNGDFNYDGLVNGSDYTLIDNAFNTQGAQILAAVASQTTEIASPPAAVPEPLGAGLIGMGITGLLLGRRRQPFAGGRPLGG